MCHPLSLSGWVCADDTPHPFSQMITKLEAEIDKNKEQAQGGLSSMRARVLNLRVMVICDGCVSQLLGAAQIQQFATQERMLNPNFFAKQRAEKAKRSLIDETFDETGIAAPDDAMVRALCSHCCCATNVHQFT